MAEQSLRERLHATHDQVVTPGSRGVLLLGSAAGAVASVSMGIGMGLLWAVPGLIIAAACLWAFFVRGAHAT